VIYVQNAQGIAQKMRALYSELAKSDGKTLKAPAARTTAAGSLAVPVFPLDMADKMGIGAMGVTAELWLDEKASAMNCALALIRSSASSLPI